MQLTDLWQVGFPMGVSKVTLAELLAKKYPSYNWEKLYLLKGRFAQQKRLEQAVEALFPVLFLQPPSCLNYEREETHFTKTWFIARASR